MADIYHDLPIRADVSAVFDAVSTPEGLSRWWPSSCRGERTPGAIYQLDFGPQYQWKAEVARLDKGRAFELRMVESDADWNGTRVGFGLRSNQEATQLSFHHTGWPELNDHCRSSSFCWAMYLRCLKRFLEQGEIIDYENRFAGEP